MFRSVKQQTELTGCERLAARVRQQTIEAAAEMLDVKPDRGRASGIRVRTSRQIMRQTFVRYRRGADARRSTHATVLFVAGILK
jgi:hypothetical protein